MAIDVFICHCAFRFHSTADLLKMNFQELRYFYRLAREAEKAEREMYK